MLSKHKEYALAVGDNQIIDAKSRRCYWDKRRNNVTIDNAVYYTFAEFLKKRRKDGYKPAKFGTYKSLLIGNYITNGKMFRIQALIRVGKYIPGMKLEDWYINLQLAKFYKMKFIDEILLSYRWHDTNSIKNVAYMKGSDKKILKNEEKNHPQWFKKYATEIKIRNIFRQIFYVMKMWLKFFEKD